MPSPIYERRAREARFLLDKGFSKDAAARKVGLAACTLRVYLKGQVFPTSKIAPTLYDIDCDLDSPDKMKSAIQLRKIRFSYCRIAKLLNISLYRIYGWRDRGVFDSIEKECAL